MAAKGNNFNHKNKELRCRHCGVEIYFDKNRVSGRSRKMYPLETKTGARYQCQQYHSSIENKTVSSRRADEIYAELIKLGINVHPGETTAARSSKIEKKPLIEEDGEEQKSSNYNQHASPPAISIYENSSEDDEVDDKTIIEYRPQDYREE